MLRIAFVIRSDGLIKSGGDTDLAKQFSALITDQINITASVVLYRDLNIAHFDLIVLFNIDMPFENFIVARECMRQKIPYVIYPLHPKARHIDDFLRYGTIGAQYLAASIAGYSVIRYETIACVVRLIKTKQWQKLLSYRTGGYAARYVLRNAARVLVSCTGEEEYIRRDFAANARFDVIPHIVAEKGLANSTDRASGSTRNAGGTVLCAGRIEPRKNQMAVVEIAKANPDICFLFLGKKNWNHKKYIRRFEIAVASYENIKWRDHVSLSELQHLITSARAYISLSWFEVSSLIDLMALASQTPSILSTGSYLYDQILCGEDVRGVKFVEPNDITTAGKCLRSLPTQAIIPRGVIMDESWGENSIRQKWIEIVNTVSNGCI
jgi:glycosyltransferase involved in cell wall biosynthesis